MGNLTNFSVNCQFNSLSFPNLGLVCYFSLKFSPLTVMNLLVFFTCLYSDIHLIYSGANIVHLIHL